MTRLNTSYGLDNPLQKVFPQPVISTRAPTSSDFKYPLGITWVNKSANTSYVLTSVSAGAATWALSSPGSSDVDTLEADSGTSPVVPSGGAITMTGGTNISTVGGTNEITFDLDDAITLATSVSSPIYTSAADMAINMPAGAFDLTVKLADAAGAQKLIFTDSADAEIANLDSDGQLNLLAGDCIVVRSDASAEVLIDVTNSDNTSATSDAFFEAAVGGTSSGNPGIRFQISGGQNYAIGIDNADSDKLVICADNDLGTDVLMKLDETTKDVEISQGNLVIGAVAKQLQMNGGAVTDFIGQATLSSGTVTVLNTNIAAGDRIFVTRSSLNGSTALGELVTTISAATSFTITSVDVSDGSTTITADTSIVDYFIVRQN